MARKQRKKRCIIKNCPSESHSRGLCQNHYATAAYAVNKGEATWEELVEFGLAEPAKRPGRKSDFYEKLAKAKAAT